MSAVVRLTVDAQEAGTVLRLAEVPMPGDRIELADGTMIVVHEIERRSRVIVAADVRARSAS
jgi:hypothetical protein